MFRIIAIDHDLISFTDEVQNNWPYILITNPKDARYLSSNEPYERMELSTHIHLLIFSIYPIQEIIVEIDNQLIYEKTIHNYDINNPFYAIPCKSKEYLNGLHQITVKVIDIHNKIKSTDHYFSLNGQTRPFDNYFSQWILIGPIQQILIWAFVIIDIFIFFWLILLKNSPPDSKNQQNSTIDKLKYFFFYRCYMLRQNSVIYYILLVFWGSVLFIPWFVGEISPNHFGCVFLWGIIHLFEKSPKKFVMEYFFTLDTHLYASFLLFSFLSSLLYFWIFSGTNNLSFLHSLSRKKRALFALFVYLFSIYQIHNSFSVIRRIYVIYNWYSLLLSPVVAWYNSFVILYCLKFVVGIILKSIQNTKIEQPTTNTKKGNKAGNKKKS